MINWECEEKIVGWKNWFITKSIINGGGIAKLGVRLLKLIWEISKWIRTKLDGMEKREKITVTKFIRKTLRNCLSQG